VGVSTGVLDAARPSAAFLRGVDPDYQTKQVRQENRVRAELHNVVAAAAAGDSGLLDELEFGGSLDGLGRSQARRTIGWWPRADRHAGFARCRSLGFVK
jgi:hypothetical protein